MYNQDNHSVSKFDEKAGSILIKSISESQEFKIIVDYLNSVETTLIDELITFCQIPAPSYEEDLRAYYILERMSKQGLYEVHIDQYKNVIGRYPGKSKKIAVVVCAHTDIVFSKDVQLNVIRNDDKIYCPGIGDNSSSVIGMLGIIDAWRKSLYIPSCDVIFVADSCEEGLGDLRGIKGFLSEYKKRKNLKLKYILALDGTIDSICNAGIGSRRLKVNVLAKGGHSWGNFGSPSAIHTLGAIIHDITKLNVPTNPKTTFNIGIIEGGTSVNTIAEHASMLIDLRSVGEKELKDIEESVRKIIDKRVKEYNSSGNIEVVGDRPAGFIPENHILVQLAKFCGEYYGIKQDMRAASTDANIPLSQDLPALTIGLYKGQGAHTRSEYMISTSLIPGILYTTLFLMSILKDINID